MMRARTIAWRALGLLAVVAVLAGLVAVPALANPPQDVGVVDQDQGLWYIHNESGTVVEFYFGDPGDVPLMGDWNGDGHETPGVYRPSTGELILRPTMFSTDVTSFTYGDPGDQPVAGDWDGDGVDTVSMYRPDEARMYVADGLGHDGKGLGAADYAFTYGDPGDEVIAGDFDGDGVDTLAVSRPDEAKAYIRQANEKGAADEVVLFGDPGDTMLCGDWIEQGYETVAVHRDGKFHLRYENDAGVADEVVIFGDPAFRPIVGEFHLAM